ncbi:MAG: class I SAM-dependent RNA methyltransferase [Microbacteriaceae bacterium]|nr:class I SAM-dependent RNA methyltransferase [Microbacteriaceae bacterium]
MKTNWLGQELELTISKVAHGGVFVARHENRVVFVSHAIPGEKVVARVFEDNGGSYARAETIQVLEASPDRVPHFWKKSAIAGGVEFGHIALSRQRELKAEVLKEGLERFAKLDSSVPVESIDDDETGLHYRTRIQLHVNEFGDAGFYRERSHEVVIVKSIPLAVPEIEELGLHLKNWQNVKKIQIAASNTGGLQWLVDKKVQGDQVLLESVLGRTYRLSPGAFWQVHKNAARVLSQTVIDFARDVGLEKQADNLDLYGGAGLFSGSLAGAFGQDIKLTSVETSKVAVSDAQKNLADLTRFKAVATSTMDFLKRTASLDAASTVILDPPRSGAGREVITELVRLEPKHLIYVACDPIALARDLGQLVPAGYKILKMRAFDLFPHTHHFETVVSLVR